MSKKHEVDNESILSRLEETELYEAIRDDKKIYAHTTFDRAIPYYKDGLISVYRRILYAMYEKGLLYTGAGAKSALIVGDIIGNYHPHGDIAVYNSMVTLSQEWTQNHPLIHGHGNWGNVFGNCAAAYRYTSCELSKFFTDAVEDITPNTVDYMFNYDDRLKEASYIPFKVPVVLVNGSYGIAESYVTSIHPHNLNDIIRICKTYIGNKSIPNEILVEGLYPDYPNYGIITNKSEIEQSYKFGTKANVKMKSTVEIDEVNRRIFIKDLAYGTVRNNITDVLIDQNAKKHAVLSKVLDIINIKTKRNGEEHFEYEVTFEKSCNVFEVARDIEKFCLTKTIPLNIIYNFGDKVKNVTIKEIVEHWYRILKITKLRKISYKISQLQNKTHVLEGLIKIYDYLDEVIKFSKTVKSDKEFIEWLIKKFNVFPLQAEAIADMKLRNLSGHSKQSLLDSIQDNKDKMKAFENDMMNVDVHILNDLDELSRKYGRPRRTVVMDDSEEQVTSIPMSNGALLFSYDQYVIFDLQNILNGKALLNGLRSTKVDGKNVKEICGIHNIHKNIIGLLVITSAGTARRVDVTEIIGINNWIVMDGIEIVGMVPISTEKDKLLIISDDNKMRIVNVSDINKQFVNISKVKMVQKLEEDADHLILVSETGKYHCVALSEIPELSRIASGIQINVPSKELISMVQVKLRGEQSLMLSLLDTDENIDYIMKVELDAIVVTNRVNKPKTMLQLGPNYKISNVNKANSRIKNSKLVLLGKHSSSQLSIQNFKNSDITVTPKKVPVGPMAVIQYLQ